MQFTYEHLDQALVAVARLARFVTFSGSTEIAKIHTFDHSRGIDSVAWLVTVNHKHMDMEEVRDPIQEIGSLNEWID